MKASHSVGVVHDFAFFFLLSSLFSVLLYALSLALPAPQCEPCGLASADVPRIVGRDQNE